MQQATKVKETIESQSEAKIQAVKPELGNTSPIQAREVLENTSSNAQEIVRSEEPDAGITSPEDLDEMKRETRVPI